MSLTKQQRDALPASDFAVPGKRALPMHDAKHTRMAWDMVERTGGLTPEEKRTARTRILRRAKEQGVDTTEWSKIKSMSLEAMSLAMPMVADHPNRMPFSGVLTRIGEPSDEPPHGSGGRCILLTAEAAEKALPSLLGMAVDFMPSFDGHDPQAKIGIITDATIEGNAIHVEGFIYAADFPNQSARIRADKDVLGFSFEAQNIVVADPGADVLEIVSCVFTGAAILRKDRAAYQTTSLAAAAAKEIDMTKEELQALLGETLTTALKPVTERLDKIEAEARDKIDANKATMGKVEPHAKALEAAAAAMETDGIGCAAQSGHVSVLRRMASSMRAESAVGKVPHIFRDHDYPYSAAAELKPHDFSGEVKKAVDEATKPLKAELDAANTKLADLKAAAVKASTEPQRKTLSPAVSAILARSSISLPEGDGKIDINTLDSALAKSGLDISKRLQVKAGLTHAGLL